MIVYHDTIADRDTPPPWLVGAVNLHRRDGRGERWWGVGPSPWLVGNHAGEWHALADGWRCRIVGDFDPRELRRDQLWCDTSPAVDLSGRRWCAPELLGADGGPIFRVRYGGADFLPLLTPEQEQGKAIAIAARAAIAAGGIDGAHSRQWAARLLPIVNHISTEVLAALGLIDDVLVISTLAPATGMPLRREAVPAP